MMIPAFLLIDCEERRKTVMPVKYLSRFMATKALALCLPLALMGCLGSDYQVVVPAHTTQDAPMPQQAQLNVDTMTVTDPFQHSQAAQRYGTFRPPLGYKVNESVEVFPLDDWTPAVVQRNQ